MSSFHVDIESGTAVITLDVTGAPVNTLSTAVAQEFDGLLTRLESDPMVGSIVLISGKAENFIAGADIEEFTRLRTAEEATALSRQAQELMNRVEACRKPVVVSRAGGASELIESDVNALAFTPGEAAELAQRIEELARDANLRERLGRAGRSMAEQRFHRRRMASELAPIYESLVH